MSDSFHRVESARTFAVKAHGDQKYGDLPYVHHLDAVARLLQPFGPTLQVIGYLHDVAEDTPVGLDEIRETFGEHVARCVALVTDVPGENRAARKRATNEKLSLAQGPERDALIVKAADRLANLQASSGRHLKMYVAEHPAFREAAYRAGLCDELWTEIDRIIAGAAVG